MTSESSASSRREFLTGEAARKELLRAAREVGDAILEQGLFAPVAGDTVRLETRAMACPWCVILNPGPPRQVMVASDAFAEVHHVEDLLTVYRDNSVISRVNREAETAPIQVDESLFGFLKQCLDLWKSTDGAFDIASGALIDLWRDCRGDGRIPTRSEVTETVERVGSQFIELNESAQTIHLQKPVKLDFGAIGKGWAIDRAAGHLLNEGVEDFLVHGGHSSLRAQGNHAGYPGWPVGLRNPQFTDLPFATVLLQNQALSSSGSNIQYFRHEGKRYGHILDPRTGWPAVGLISATVICEDAALADALSTAMYVMGLDKAVRYCDDHPEVGAILIPNPEQSRRLDPVICNIPDEVLFFHPDGRTGSPSKPNVVK